MSGDKAGDWTIEATPNGPGGGNSFLSDVTCPAQDDCWAVGNYWSGTSQQPLILRWNGEAWGVVMPSPPDGVKSEFLGDVTCASSSECWTVGFFFDRNTGTYLTLAMEWDGDSWRRVPSPQGEGTVDGKLAALFCAEPSSCWAVGTDTRSSPPFSIQTLALRRVPTPVGMDATI